MRQLWTNGRFTTMLAENHTVDALIIHNGTIVHTGAEKDLRLLTSEYDEVKDAQNKAYYPGFVDSHVHLIGHGESLLTIDLSTITSHKELLHTLATNVSNTPKGQWVIGEGFDEETFADAQTIPDKWALDIISTEHPIVIKRKCRHVYSGNSLALQKAGIGPLDPDPTGGVMDRKNGEITGVVRDRAVDKLMEAIPSKSKEYVRTAAEKAIKDAWSKGLVGAHSEDLSYYGDPATPFSVYKELVREMPFRLHLLVHHLAVKRMKELSSLHFNAPFLETGAIKVFVDGSLGGRTALLSTPYKDQSDSYGISIHSNDVLEELVVQARSEGKNVAFHVIGDQAVEKVLDLLEKYRCPEGLRDRLIHVPLLHHSLIARMSELPLIADIQPLFLPSDIGFLHRRIHEDVQTHRYAWKSLLRQHIVCAGGSDTPIESISPISGMRAAVGRVVTLENQEIVYEERELLTVFEAISLYTTGAAFAIGKEGVMGKIAPGYYADFTVLSDRLEELPLSAWTDDCIVETIVAGETVYSKEEVEDTHG